MQFLLDENLPRSVAELFKRKGYEIVHVLDSALRGSPDETISEYALKDNYTIVTSDKGFSDIRKYPPSKYDGIIVFRFRDDMEQALILKLASSVLNQIALMPDLKGRLILVEENQIRVR